MSVSEKLIKAVSEKNIIAIRDALWSRITLDPNFTKGFQESWQYCLDNGIRENDLYEAHDGRNLSDEVTNDNFSNLCGQLRTNFSKERLDRIKQIGRILYPVPENTTLLSATNKVNQKVYATKRNDNPKSLIIASLAVGGAFLGGIIGGIIIKKVVIGMVAGATLGGMAGIVYSKKQE